MHNENYNWMKKSVESVKIFFCIWDFVSEKGDVKNSIQFSRLAGDHYFSSRLCISRDLLSDILLK